MKRLTCEMCGSTNVLKEEGVFVCQACGTRYSVEEAKKMMIEGTVEVHGTVKVDKNAEIPNFIKRIFGFFKVEGFGEAEEYCKKILDIDADNEFALAMLEVLKNVKWCKDETALIRNLFRDYNYIKIRDMQDDTLKNCINKWEAPYYIDAERGYIFTKDKKSLILYYGQDDVIEVPNDVTLICKGAFYNCKSLTSVTIPDSVTTIGKYAFGKCKSLTSVVIPNNVAIIEGYAFVDCESLTSVTIPNSVTTIDVNAFNNCKSLTSVTIAL